MPLVSFENVTLGYEGVPVITGLNFEINRGDYLCVVGQNGSGKSTMMKALLGLMSPMSGKINRNTAKNAVGYLSQQQPNQADFPASVREVVLSGCQNRNGFMPFYRKEDKELAASQMEQMHISHLATKSFRELSGGQKQRVLLARSLCAAKELLLLDEPVAGLDPMVTKELYDLVENINRERKVTVVMVSHDLKDSLHAASHVLHLDHHMQYFGPVSRYDGKIMEEVRGYDNGDRD